MKKAIIFFTIYFCLSSYSISQVKYFIYFNDKGALPQTALLKTSAKYIGATKQLTSRCIERRKKVMGEDFITYEDIPLEETYIKGIEALGIKIIHKLKWFNAVTAYLTEKEILELQKFSFVKKVVPVKILSFFNDSMEKQEIKDSIGESITNQSYERLKKNYRSNYGPSFAQYNLSDIPAVHDLGINGQGVIIGILDSGFRWKDNKALMNLHVIAEYDFVQGDSVTANQSGDIDGQDNHGTGVFSILAGYDLDNIIGPAYGSTFILAKTENIASETHIEEDNYAAALEWMENMGVDITTSSLGYSIFDPGESSYSYSDMNGNTTIVTKAANLAFQRGVVTFDAAGNEGGTKWHYITAPADAYKILAVGAVTPEGQKANFSSFGPTYDGRIKPELVAQGTSVYHAISGGGYTFGSGTSYSCPIAAGIAAMLLSTFPYLSNEQVRQTLIQTASNYSTPNNEIGFGIVSALRAVTFPNLSFENNIYTVHKIFVDSNGIQPQSVKIMYMANDGVVKEDICTFDGKMKYNFNFPSYNNGEKINFSFSYKNNKGILIYEPSEGSFKFTYGNLSVEKTDEVITTEPIPQTFLLSQNYPNPFNGKTAIEFSLPNNSYVEIIVYNVLGQEIKKLFSGVVRQGKNIVYWDGKTDSNNFTASGVYFYCLKSDNTFIAKKMMYLK
ncbi:S8 family serine peptidase [Melioribacteraceae bacterium 4301-Me]|uniref:S8 family serine peptidase n=1 Tax=Pyranulibacter aquaticus TaxID=3163344 RepID=UPI00359BF1C5